MLERITYNIKNALEKSKHVYNLKGLATWLVGPSINDFVHFWASEGWPGRVSLGWGLGQMTED